mmetsp:Transcript_96707/g.273894  ORF Transcript_96707/g.273894 Transcript_96707/m.273894 type:complete len:221 (+) Transcript_96707:825-1487(+)
MVIANSDTIALGMLLKSPPSTGQLVRHMMLTELPNVKSRKHSAVRNCLTSEITWPQTSRNAEISVENTARSMRISQWTAIAVMEKTEYLYVRPSDRGQYSVGHVGAPTHQNMGSWVHITTSRSISVRLMMLYMFFSLFAMPLRVSSAVPGPSSSRSTFMAFLISSFTVSLNLCRASIISSESIWPFPSVSISSMILLMVFRDQYHIRERWNLARRPRPTM